MNDNFFLEQVEENVKMNLMYPYHIHHDKLLGNVYHNPDYPDSYHTHKYVEAIHTAYMEPKAFYLTDEDKKYYSAQEIELIERVIADETRKVDDGMVIMNLDLEEDTIEMLEEYKHAMGLTTEEAIIKILTDTIKNPELLKQCMDQNK